MPTSVLCVFSCPSSIWFDQHFLSGLWNNGNGNILLFDVETGQEKTALVYQSPTVFWQGAGVLGKVRKLKLQNLITFLSYSVTKLDNLS